MKPLFAILLFFTTPLFAISRDSEKTLEALETAIRKEIDAAQSSQNGTSTDPRMGAPTAALSYLTRLKLELSRENYQQTPEFLIQITAMFRSPEIQKLVDQLASALEAERVAAETMLQDQYAQALARAKSAVQSSKKPADLDAIIIELSRLREQHNQRQQYGGQRIKLPQVDPVLRFVTQWQDYLSALEAKDHDRARSALQNLSQNDQSPDLLPRSEILALLQKIPARNQPAAVAAVSDSEFDEQALAILAKVKKLEHMRGALEALQALQKNKGRQSEGDLNQIYRALEAMQRTYQEFSSGLPTNIQAGRYDHNISSRAAETLLPLKNQLFLLILPRYINAPEGTVAKPGETIQEFLERIQSLARSKGDPALALRARSTLNSLLNASFYTGADYAALRAFNSAQKQESAGQWMLAVMSYQEALKGGSEITPAEWIGERLKILEKDHPEDYRQGMERFLKTPTETPAPDRYPASTRSSRTNNETPATVSLLIPPPPVTSENGTR